MKNRPIYYKSIGVSDFKVYEGSRKVSGYLAAFNNIDDAGDLIMPGAFLKSINDRGPQSATNRKIAFLDQHCMDDINGVFTLLQEDEKGLYFEALMDDTDTGNTTLARYASGSYNQHSIGYQYVWDKCKYEDRPDPITGETKSVFVCYELKLWEGSTVTMGCNENTPFTGFKELQIEDQRKKLNMEADSLLNNLPQEKQYQFRQLISKYMALNEVEPVETLKQQKAAENYDRLTELFTLQKTNQ